MFPTAFAVLLVLNLIAGARGVGFCRGAVVVLSWRGWGSPKMDFFGPDCGVAAVVSEYYINPAKLVT